MKTMMNGIKVAVIQFDNPDDEYTKKLAKELDIDWYIFDETADKDFEIAALRDFYDCIYNYVHKDNFIEV